MLMCPFRRSFRRSRSRVVTIVQGMKAEPENTKVQAHACKRLAKFALLDHNGQQVMRLAIAETGGTAAVISAMQLHVSNVELQREACNALGNLAFHNTVNRVIIDDENGVSAIITAMLLHADDASVQVAGCRALQNLAAADPSCRKNNCSIMYAAGVVEVIVTALQSHPDNVKLQTNGCGALLNLAFGAKHKAMIFEAGGISAVLQAMRRHEKVPDIQCHGAGLLCNMMHQASAEYQRWIVAEQGIEVLVSALTRHPKDERIQRYSLHALGQTGCAVSENDFLALTDASSCESTQELSFASP